MDGIELVAPPPATHAGSAADHAYERLKQLILTNDLQPGIELREATLAESTGFGRTPIREALARLVRDGFVDVRPRQGYRVSTVSLTRVRELFEMRLLLEPVAAELAATRASDADIAALAELAGRHYDGGSNYEDFLRDNREFHVRLALAAGNTILARSLRTLLEEMQRLHFVSLGRSVSEPLHQHHELYDAVRSRNPALARAIVEEQIEASRQQVTAALLLS